MLTENNRSESSLQVLIRMLLLGLGMVIAFMPLGRNALPRAAAGRPAPPHGMEKIQHVIWIIQENHSFDNYFGTFPNADGIPPSTCLAEMPGSRKCVKPFHMPAGQPLLDLEHSWETAQAAYDHGTMDGFVWVEGSPYTMGYWDITMRRIFPTTGGTRASSPSATASSPRR
jgi:phospholipase C